MTAPTDPQQAESHATGDLYAALFGRSSADLEVITSRRLQRVGSRPPLNLYIAKVWQRRHFLVADARARVTSANHEALLGKAWLILSPVLDGLTYFLVFGLLLGTNRGIPNFMGYLLIGVFLFSFTSRCVAGGARSVSSGRNLIRAFAFPRVALPIAVVVREVFNMAWVLAALASLLLIIPGDAEMNGQMIQWTWRLVLVIPALALQLLLATGLAMVLARICAALPDLTQVIGFATRLWMFGSAVMFSAERFASQPVAHALLQANPMFMVIDIVRNSVLYAVTPPLSQWFWLVIWAISTFTVGFLIFWQAEETYGRA